MVDRHTNREALIQYANDRRVPYDALMLRRVHNILLVSSPYDSFTFEEDGRLTELLFSEYLELNLRYAPNIMRVSTAEEALQALQRSTFDLVISMLRVGDMDVADFGREVATMAPNLPVILLTYNTRELTVLDDVSGLVGIDRVFAWLGDVRLFLAIIKYVEDRMNAYHDSRTAGVKVIILIEDNVRFYSSYLPLVYTELVQQTQNLMSDGLNHLDKLVRMRARHKVLLATDYEEGERLYLDNIDHVSGVILDARFPRNGQLDSAAGIEFAKFVKGRTPDRPVLIQSSDKHNRGPARAIGAQFIDKESPNLLDGLRQFMRNHMGFGDFVFRMPDGRKIGKATDLRTLTEMLATIPVESLVHHVSRNDFSTWIMARTEFDLAKILRPRHVDEFANAEGMRQYLIEEIHRHRDRSRAGVVADFSSVTFEGSSGFVRIGAGSLGGKGRGLAFINKLLDRQKLEQEQQDVRVFVPPTAVIASGLFDEFMQRDGLLEIAFGDAPDQEIARAFLAAELSDEDMAILRTILSRVHYPLAVRSSSLLEDASHQPFAGLYRTYMIPNNHPDIEVRIQQLVSAIKLVYASTFYADAKAYIESTPNRLEEEKMAVVVQRLFGRQHGQYLYPDFAGVARSYDFYPMEGRSFEQGVANVVLGLGKMVVDGGRAVRFSPTHPRQLFQFSSVKETLDAAQREFLALDLNHTVRDMQEMTEASGLVTLGLDVAEKDGVLPALGSVYSHENQAIYDGTSRPGPRLVTLAGVLKANVYPLAKTLVQLLDLGTQAFSSHVEIEFACNIRKNRDEKHEFAFLQIRPIVVGSRSQEINLDALDRESTICIAKKALGNGLIQDVRDIVYVPMSRFDRSKTVAIAKEIGGLSLKLKGAGRPFLLAGPGRWGSADRWLGIPVTWRQISGARCIVETDMDDIRVTPSQGTHFFQNLTAFGIGYFTVNFDSVGGNLDTEWLDAQPAVEETPHVRHLTFASPLQILVSARQGVGVVMKPGQHIKRQSNPMMM
ncbi:MAG: PEP/pyruvate-binding domain-containing protein [Myxococcota bacterium]|nr:PEP/pyruvate-binding domain-containing protein [Myxococcota bacterium]